MGKECGVEAFEAGDCEAVACRSCLWEQCLGIEKHGTIGA